MEEINISESEAKDIQAVDEAGTEIKDIPLNAIEAAESVFEGIDENQEQIEVLSDSEMNILQDGLYSEQDKTDDLEKKDDFAKMIDSMSLDELNAEREKLVEWGVLNDEAIEKQRAAEDEFNSRIEGLSREQLQTLRERLDNKDPEILAVFGQDDTADESGAQKVLRRR